MSLYQLSEEIVALNRNVQAGVVLVQQTADDGSVSAVASGTLWTRAGIVVTVSHPFDDPESISVVHGSDAPRKVRVRGWDNRFDLAVLEVEGGELATWSDWSELEELRPGELAFAVGHQEIRMGMVSRVLAEQVNRWGGTVKPWVEVDGSLGERQVGGPLVNREGRFVGVNSLHPRPYGQTVGYGQLQNLVQALLTRGNPRPAFLGIRTVTGETSDGARGLVVTKVDAASPADTAGVVTGDILLDIAGVHLEHPRQLFMALRGMNAGDTVAVTLRRGAHRETVTATLGGRA